MRCGGSVEGHGGVPRLALRGCTGGVEGKKGMESVQRGRGVYRGMHGGIWSFGGYRGVLRRYREHTGVQKGNEGDMEEDPEIIRGCTWAWWKVD